MGRPIKSVTWVQNDRFNDAGAQRRTSYCEDKMKGIMEEILPQNSQPHIKDEKLRRELAERRAKARQAKPLPSPRLISISPEEVAEAERQHSGLMPTPKERERSGIIAIEMPAGGILGMETSQIEAQIRARVALDEKGLRVHQNEPLGTKTTGEHPLLSSEPAPLPPPPPAELSAEKIAAMPDPTADPGQAVPDELMVEVSAPFVLAPLIGNRLPERQMASATTPPPRRHKIHHVWLVFGIFFGAAAALVMVFSHLASSHVESARVIRHEALPVTPRSHPTAMPLVEPPPSANTTPPPTGPSPALTPRRIALSWAKTRHQLLVELISGASHCHLQFQEGDPLLEECRLARNYCQTHAKACGLLASKH